MAGLVAQATLLSCLNSHLKAGAKLPRGFQRQHRERRLGVDCSRWVEQQQQQQRILISARG